MTRFLSVAQQEVTRRIGVPLGWVVSYCCLYRNKGLFGSTRHLTQQHQQQQQQNPSNNPAAAEINGSRYHQQHRSNQRAEQQDFKVSVTGGQTLTVEILDGGVCLESAAAGDDDDIQVNRRRLQQAIERAISCSASSSSTTTASPTSSPTSSQTTTSSKINKLDLFASHFRANLTATMIGSILQVLPPLEHLQLGGLRLSVEELCLLLAQPALTRRLTHLALYDLEFTNHNDNNNNNAAAVNQEEPNFASLQLQEVVAVFLRLESDQVTLDPLFHTLQRAPKLKQLELVLDHNHAYIHGYPRTDQQQQHQQQLFSAPAFCKMLQATRMHLSNIILEYVTLTAQHFEALAQHGESLKQLRLRDDPEMTNADSNSTMMKALASFLSSQKKNSSKGDTTSRIEHVSLDGIISQTKDVTELCHVLASNQSIQWLRLRSLPLQLNDLTVLLSNNVTLQHLALHNIDFEETAKCDSGDDINETTSTTVATSGEDMDLLEESVFATLVKVLRDHNNTTLRRISWKQAEFKRTEAFPRRRKPKIYKCFQQKQKQKNLQQQQKAQLQLLHWYLTLNHRGIRNMMADVTLSRSEFLKVLACQKHHHEQQQQRHPTLWPGQQQQLAMAATHQTQPMRHHGNSDENEDELLDEYSLDCLYYMLSNNPSLCG